MAEHNDVTAIEPDEDSIKERWADHQYTQIAGSTGEITWYENLLGYAAESGDS